MGSLRGRAEIPRREWVEFELDVDDHNVVNAVRAKVWGCHRLIEAAKRAEETWIRQKLTELKWSGVSHWDLLVSEALDRIQGRFKIPVEDPETCHCRKIPTSKVDEAIVLGAHTPEKVRAWTSASSGCGTCRPVLETLITYRLKRAA
jgi:bacterioferritin-associated ferredoxin